ncbi:MAG: SpoIIE family protein phosphatase [bacterium]|nr:SpoIIE family protein phosphatase [bacterium]
MHQDAGAIKIHLDSKSGVPFHRQIIDQVKDAVATGSLKQGDRLPTVRQLAVDLSVNPNSISRAYSELELTGLVETQMGSGTFIGRVSPQDMAKAKLLKRLLDEELALKELELARGIQRRLLPPARVAGRGFTVISRSEPARFVGGDFYDVLRHSDGVVGVVVADVAGKGIGASLIMASVKAMMPFVAAERSVEETLRELNRRLYGELGSRRSGPRTFVALAYVRFDPATRRLWLANAGLPDPYRLRRDADPEAIVVPGERLPLGVRAEVAYETRELELGGGESLLLLSDGIPEARRTNGDPLGYETLEELLGRGVEGGGEAWLDALLERVRELSVPEPEDDWTAVLLDSRGREGDGE